MVHCVTQQQPAASSSTGINDDLNEKIKIGQNFPNPFKQRTKIDFSLAANANNQIIIYNSLGQIVSKPVNTTYSAGNHSLTISADDLQDGIYTYLVTTDNRNYISGRMVVSK